MLKLLLKKNELESIHLLGSTLYGLDTTVSFVEQHMLKSKVTVKHDISFLNTLFEDLGYPETKMRIVNNEILIENLTDDIHNNLMFEACAYLVDNSPTYKVFSAFLAELHPHKEFVLAYSNVSDSYLTKIVKEMNLFLADMDLQIASRKQRYKLIGPPLNALYFEFLLRQSLTFLTATEEIESPVDYEEIESDSIVEPKITTSLYATLESVTPFENNFTDDSHVLEIMSHLMTVNDISPLIHSSVTPIEQNKMLINLFLRITGSQVDTVEQRREFGKELIKLNKVDQSNYMIDDSIYIAGIFATRFSKNDAEKETMFYEALYVIIIKQLMFNLMKTNVEKLFNPTPDFLTQFQRKTPKQSEMADFAKTIFECDAVSDLTKEMLTNYKYRFKSDLFSIIPQSTPHIKVHIDMSYHLSREYYLKKKIKRIFSDDAISFSNTRENVDIIVSDRISNIPDGTAFFFLLNPNSTQSVELMMSFIMSEYLKKLSHFQATEA
ncbi:hypothetical protein G7081_06850 [Vagococcus coleopterorum]|uniref:Mga helix-turn-helix domain-containing protein n=1 Tax=Vagococcus coleopterorum TaxID=2714946 RepID=A0A6G8APE8_9ENTE|nr:helix-turn-helix domain-containing protein [Vagococcus coleopterorum]QIL46805.1 hypothetical protein G7081_06850 [Vagococcus coleopterorum]